MQLRNMKIISPMLTIFSLRRIFGLVRERKPKNIANAEQEILGRASAALLAAQVKFAKLPVMLLSARSTPSKSLLPPIFIANVDGKLLSEAWVFLSAMNAGSRKKVVRPIAISEKIPVLSRLTKKFFKPLQ